VSPNKPNYRTGIAKVSHKGRGYTSDVKDKQWQRMAWLFPKRKGPGRPMRLDRRAVLNAMLDVVKTGCQWANLPSDFPNPKSVYYHFRKWSQDGTWHRINRVMGFLERRRVGRFPRPSAGILDSQSVKTTASGLERGYDGHKKIKGRKRHVFVDTQGNLLEVVVLSANCTDVTGAKAVLTKVERQIALRLLTLWADQGYQGDLSDWLHEQFAIQLEIVQAAPDQVGFAVQPRRWVVERTFAWLGQFRRLSKDYERCPRSSEGMIYLAAIHTLLKRLPV
jgi:putative transposase